MAEPRTLMLTPADLPAGVPGAVTIDATCGHRAWISPSGMTLLLGGGIDTSCWRCVDADQMSEFSTVPGGADELAAILGPEHAQQILDKAEADPQRAVRALQRYAGKRPR